MEHTDSAGNLVGALGRSDHSVLYQLQPSSDAQRKTAEELEKTSAELARLVERTGELERLLKEVE
jgi:hypothetical protein